MRDVKRALVGKERGHPSADMALVELEQAATEWAAQGILLGLVLRKTRSILSFQKRFPGCQNFMASGGGFARLGPNKVSRTATVVA